MNILITGGLGFIGINTALRFVKDSNHVVLFDNLSKPGSVSNLSFGRLLTHNVIIGDLRNYNDIYKVCKNCKFDIIFHFAAQTAVTFSIQDPLNDFETNVIGTFNLLEAIRKTCPDVKLIYSSTNKVYGDLTHKKIVEKERKYDFEDITGINENEPLDFYSPYGCSKGAADQYVRDYARSYNLDTTVIRQSCIYGQYQDGTEDQGWVAWFAKAFLKDAPITIYGNGKQVRDILYIDDLINFYEIIICNTNPGEIYNIGGGYYNSLSLLNLIDLLYSLMESKSKISFDDQRLGDQKIFISDNDKAKELGWYPKINILNGINKLIGYLKK
jgi:CDP-paratose 2-epimerase